jgi:hypothetical protein
VAALHALQDQSRHVAARDADAASPAPRCDDSRSRGSISTPSSEEAQAGQIRHRAGSPPPDGPALSPSCHPVRSTAVSTTSALIQRANLGHDCNGRDRGPRPAGMMKVQAWSHRSAPPQRPRMLARGRTRGGGHIPRPRVQLVGIGDQAIAQRGHIIARDLHRAAGHHQPRIGAACAGGGWSGASGAAPRR